MVGTFHLRLWIGALLIGCPDVRRRRSIAGATSLTPASRNRRRPSCLAGMSWSATRGQHPRRSPATAARSLSQRSWTATPRRCARTPARPHACCAIQRQASIRSSSSSRPRSQRPYRLRLGYYAVFIWDTEADRELLGARLHGETAQAEPFVRGQTRTPLMVLGDVISRDRPDARPTMPSSGVTSCGRFAAQPVC